MRDTALELAQFCFNNGEILNAYTICMSSPAKVREEILKSPLFLRIKTRINEISEFQIHGRENSGFVDPPDAENRVIFKKLLSKIPSGCRRMVDVGCFSGWVGRHLALRGIQVLGIDLDPHTIELANKMATGTIASYEVMEASKLGVKYPKRFDGAVLFDVLEHVFDPYVIKESVAMTVKDGGTVFINLPKWQDSDEVKEEFPDVHKEHLRTYTPSEVQKIFPNAEIEDTRNEDGSLSYFITYKV